jgi:chromosome segregation ATPase
MAFQMVDDIVVFVDKAEHELKNQQTEIETRLMNQVDTFNRELSETTQKVLAFATKDNSIPGSAPSIKEDVAQLFVDLKRLKANLDHIQDQQKDLELPDDDTKAP